MSAAESYLLLMGFHSIQLYAPYRVLRQLGRCQIVPKDEDLSSRVVEIRPGGQFPEGIVRKSWSESQTLPAKTLIENRSEGEVSPHYLPWYRRELEYQRPAKIPHVQDFAESSQAQWGWMEKEKGYQFEIGRLKQQIEKLKYENSLQIDVDTGEKNRLTQENEALKAKVQRVRKEANNQPRSRSDQRLINGLNQQLKESQESLEKSEASRARMQVRWEKGTRERRKYLQQVKRGYEMSIEILTETNSTLQERVVRQGREAREERKQCYDMMAIMEAQMEKFQNRLVDNARVLGLKNQQIEQMFRERDGIQERIDEIGRYIHMRYLSCEQMPQDALFSSVMGYIRQIMGELKNLRRGLTPKPAKRPKDASGHQN
uniref:Uncharacterized protein n=1 Tax=Nicotiana tabacum TaxID=4097 RepID=A0A1S3YEM5_TOBAC|nr:PREDICTED: uncharacterized protein LOC107775434 [Nicotiana tabacum]